MLRYGQYIGINLADKRKESDLDDLIIQKWPGVATVANAKRKSISLDRPWQKRITTSYGNPCPLCEEVKFVKRYKAAGGEVVVVNNIRPMYDFHILIFPKSCHSQSNDLKKVLGKPESIQCVFDLAEKLVNSDGDAWLVANIGGLVGQSIRHMHYHLLEPHGPSIAAKAQDELLEMREEESLVIARDGNCVAFAGGHRPGQCLVLPQGDLRSLETGDLARMFHFLINLYARKFRSNQGLQPEYQIAAVLEKKQIRYAAYIPALSQFGAAQYLALLEGREFPLQWPHSETAKFLRK